MDSKLVEALVVESAVLEELAKELECEGHVDLASRVRQSIEIADSSRDPVEKVKEIVVLLRHVDYALEGTSLAPVSTGIRRIRRRLTYEANRLLPDTLRLRATGEYSVLDDKK